MRPEVCLYVHVPFCRARCTYCDFTTYAGLEDLIPAYLVAVRQEVESAAARWGRLVAPTIYFGGGTPTLVPPALLAPLLSGIRRVFRVPEDAEFSLEANPGTITAASLRELRNLGVNRLSLGAQSAHDAELGLLSRIHTWAQVVESVGWARKGGFTNLSLDFIFGLPGQTVASWQQTLEAALSLEPEHLSLYCLTIEEGTPLERRVAAGELSAPDDDVAAEMYECAEERLEEAGFFHYEISNWARAPGGRVGLSAWWPPMRGARPGCASEDISSFVCRHNLRYWRNDPWLGFAAGAHSWLEGRRWANLPHPRDYLVASARGDSPVAESETIGRRVEMGETMMMGLRLAEGVGEARFRARFGLGLAEAFGEELTDLRHRGLLEYDGQAARLTAQGRLLGNLVFERFV